MTGTDLSIDKNISEGEISKVTKWCEDICKIIEEKNANEKGQVENNKTYKTYKK
jgi:hypothetical protein